MLLLMPRAARADDRAFQWLRIDPPSEDALDSVQDVNNAGHILAKVKVGGTTRAAVYRDNVWHILEVSTNHTTQGNDINNDGTVVGYSGSGINLKARIWYYDNDPQSPTYLEYKPGIDLGQYTQIWAINDWDELAAFDEGNGYPVGWFAEQTGWTQLNPLSGGDATAALGINGDGPPATIVGLSTEQLNQDPMLAWAVAWPGTTTPVKIDPGQTDESDTPYIINDNDWIVGSRDSGTTPPYAYILWRPDGQGGWGGVETLGSITGANPKAVGLNNSNEVVAKKTLFYEDANLVLQDLSLLTLSGIPTSTGPLGHFYSTNMAYYAINDAGWIVGSAKYYDANEQDQGNVVILLVPFDRNNDDTPDYREIIANPMLDDDATVGGDWVLDWATEMRVGLHAPTTNSVSAAIEYAQIVRFMRDHIQIHDAMFDNATTCQGQSQDATKWGTNLDGGSNFSDRPKEIVTTIRSINVPDASGVSDTIPPASNPGQGEITQAETLAALECYGYRFARCIDYVQVGNEIWNGSGRFYVTDVEYGSFDSYTGLIADAPTAEALEACLDVVFDWLGREVVALRRGSAMAGRPLQIIGPAVSYVTLNAGATGNAAYTGEYPEEEDNPDKAAYFVQRLIEFCNEYDIPVDGHYHFFDYNEFLDGIDALTNQGNAAWDVPESIVSLEYGPIPSTRSDDDTHWWTQQNQEYTERFYDNDEETHPPSADNWADWLTVWKGSDDLWNPPDYFVYDGMTTLVSYGCRIGCYADSRQITGAQNVATQFDFSAMYTDKVGPSGAKTYTEWRTEFETAADDFLITPWNPHQNTCPDTPCPPCEE